MQAEIQQFNNLIKQQASHQSSSYAFPDVGEVIAYDPDNRLVRVQIQSATDDSPAEITGWIPVGAQWVGNGWGGFPSVQINSHALVVYTRGNPQCGVVVCFFFTDKNRPAPSDSPGYDLVHETGSTLKLKSDGTVEINCPNVVKIGDISGSLKSLITEEFANIYNDHTHSGAVPVPEKLIDQTCLTQNLKAT